MDRNNDNTVKTQTYPEPQTITDPYPGPVVNPDRKSSNRKSNPSGKSGGGKKGGKGKD